MRIFLLLLVLFWVCDLRAGEEKINAGWKFSSVDSPEVSGEKYDDSGWRVLNLPHDWAFENGYSPDGAQKDRGGYASGGIGWYRKVLSLSSDELDGRHFFIDFEAVYMNSEVWINGHYLGKRPYGYISFSYELSRYLKVGENVIAVRVDNSLEPSARWYHGCGIYGNVFLRTESNVCFEKDGIFVTTPHANGRVCIQTEINLFEHEGKYRIELDILDDQGRKVGKSVSASIGLKQGLNLFDFETEVKSPLLWTPDTPNLYLLKIRLADGSGKDIDISDIRFGFKDFTWKPETGFYLNGKQLKLRGVCEHLEGGPTGAFSTEKLLRWKLQLIKDMGCNAVRTAHNPQLPLFYDLCDEMGLLVMDEVFDGWHKKALYDYGMQAFNEWWERDLRAFVRRDRNHPSVFLYSVGNETKGKVAKDLVRVCHEEDPTRLVTSGDAGAEQMDVHGVNGNSEKVRFLETYKPVKRAFIGTENPHTWQVRGYYRTKTWYRDGFPNMKQDPMVITDLTDKEIFAYDWIAPGQRRNVKQVFNSSYDNATVRVTARRILELLRDCNWFSGSFRWTGFDYLGEAGFVHGGWPFRAFQGGALDLAGFPKDLYYLYQSEWADKDMVHILPHWTHPTMKEGTRIPVWIYTSGDEVELIVNGKSLGRKKKGRSWKQMQCEWMVPWKPGTVEAVAYRKGKEIARTVRKTALAPAFLEVDADNKSLMADNEDISIVSIQQKDVTGVLYPYGENRVYTRIIGNARMLSFENGNPVDTECNFNATSKKCFFGLNRAFIQSTGGDVKKPVTMVLGGICGDKKLMLSDKISISCQEVALRGKLSERDWQIRYTIDGSIPTLQSKLYVRPFPVELGTTVKAVLYDGNEKILEMEERFAHDEGLYWEEPGEAVCGFTGDKRSSDRSNR